VVAQAGPDVDVQPDVHDQPASAPIETVGGETRGTAQYVVTDGNRILQVLHVQDMSYELGDNSYRRATTARTC
jgi:hypothetical protein